MRLNKTLKLNTVLKLCISIGFLLIGLSIFYYFFIWIPNKQVRVEKFLASCLANKIVIYKEEWDKLCANIGREKNCSLPEKETTELKRWNEEAEKACFKVFEKIR